MAASGVSAATIEAMLHQWMESNLTGVIVPRLADLVRRGTVEADEIQERPFDFLAVVGELITIEDADLDQAGITSFADPVFQEGWARWAQRRASTFLGRVEQLVLAELADEVDDDMAEEVDRLPSFLNVVSEADEMMQGDVPVFYRDSPRADDLFDLATDGVLAALDNGQGEFVFRRAGWQTGHVPRDNVAIVVPTPRGAIDGGGDGDTFESQPDDSRIIDEDGDGMDDQEDESDQEVEFGVEGDSEEDAFDGGATSDGDDDQVDQVDQDDAGDQGDDDQVEEDDDQVEDGGGQDTELVNFPDQKKGSPVGFILAILLAVVAMRFS